MDNLDNEEWVNFQRFATILSSASTTIEVKEAEKYFNKLRSPTTPHSEQICISVLKQVVFDNKSFIEGKYFNVAILASQNLCWLCKRRVLPLDSIDGIIYLTLQSWTLTKQNHSYLRVFAPLYSGLVSVTVMSFVYNTFQPSATENQSPIHKLRGMLPIQDQLLYIASFLPESITADQLKLAVDAVVPSASKEQREELKSLINNTIMSDCLQSGFIIDLMDSCMSAVESFTSLEFSLLIISCQNWLEYGLSGSSEKVSAIHLMIIWMSRSDLIAHVANSMQNAFFYSLNESYDEDRLVTLTNMAELFITLCKYVDCGRVLLPSSLTEEASLLSDTLTRVSKYKHPCVQYYF